MRIELITKNKEDYFDLLLLADEQKDMVEKYLYQGDMFALYDNDLKTICVVIKEDEDTYEVKNLATTPLAQGQGYGSKMLHYVFEYYKDIAKYVIVGTGECPRTLGFYEHCGFKQSHRKKNFFIDNYDHPIIEEGIQLVDMIYLKKEL